MYFPYLRGKQYELLALKELSPLLGPQNRVTPIIEPVRLSAGSGLDRCLDALIEVNLDFVLVMNPSVGKLQSEFVAEDLATFVNSYNSSSSWNLGLLFDEKTNVQALINDYSRRIGQGRRLTLIHRGVANNLTAIPSLTANLKRTFDVIDDNLRRRHFRELLESSDGVRLSDGFPLEERNSDYLPKEESTFSEDHLYYKEEGWYGFADFVTIGESFTEGGFTPRAVAIHWTYEPKPGDPIMIRHFTSESNNDTTNVGGKFLEATGKLIEFLDAQNIHTQASEVMRSHQNNSTFPGLGIVKKLSIQNHLELVSGILSRP